MWLAFEVSHAQSRPPVQRNSAGEDFKKWRLRRSHMSVKALMHSQGVPVSFQEHRGGPCVSGSLSCCLFLPSVYVHLPIALSLCDPGMVTLAKPQTGHLLSFQPSMLCAKEAHVLSEGTQI